MLPDKIRLTLFTPLPLCQKAGVTALLDGLSELKRFAPTHWGENERCRNAFVRRSMIAAVSKYPPDHYIPGIARRMAISYAGYFDADAGPAQGVRLDFSAIESEAEMMAVFELGRSLAAHLRPHFGFVHPVWLSKGQVYNVAGRLNANEFRAFGPRSLCARTWFGPHLLTLLGRERLAGAVHSLEDLPGGGVQADLLERPWEHGIVKLERARKRGMAVLADAEVFGDLSKSGHYKAGRRWVCPPADAAE